MYKFVSGMIKLALLGFLLLLLYFHDRLKIEFTYPFHTIFDNIYIRIAKICVILLMVYEVMRIFYYTIIKNPKAPKWLGSVATLAMPVVLLLAALEIAFMFVAQSHEGGLTLASHVWFARYWKPVNSQGYRDVEHTDTLGKKKVIVIGDSFAAGHGVDNADDRFSNVLAQKLGEEKYAVYNLGISGSDTRDEYERFEKAGVRPDVLILQYFPNDIEKAARQHGLVPAAFQPYSDLSKPLRLLVSRSYFLNYLYWQLPHGDFKPFDQYANRVYTDTTILNTHLQDLKKFVDYKNQHGATMYVVLFPFAFQLEKTKEYMRPIMAFFKENNIPVLEVGNLIGDLEPARRIVGRNDAHASAEVNQRVGAALYDLVASGEKNKLTLAR